MENLLSLPVRVVEEVVTDVHCNLVTRRGFQRMALRQYRLCLIGVRALETLGIGKRRNSRGTAATGLVSATSIRTILTNLFRAVTSLPPRRKPDRSRDGTALRKRTAQSSRALPNRFVTMAFARRSVGGACWMRECRDQERSSGRTSHPTALVRAPKSEKGRPFSFCTKFRDGKGSPFCYRTVCRDG